MVVDLLEQLTELPTSDQVSDLARILVVRILDRLDPSPPPNHPHQPNQHADVMGGSWNSINHAGPGSRPIDGEPGMSDWPGRHTTFRVTIDLGRRRSRTPSCGGGLITAATKSV